MDNRKTNPRNKAALEISNGDPILVDRQAEVIKMEIRVISTPITFLMT